MHKLIVLTQYSLKAIDAIYYNIARAILNIKSKPNKKSLVNITFGDIIKLCNSKYRLHLFNQANGNNLSLVNDLRL